jgi:hypothetical protein
MTPLPDGGRVCGRTGLVLTPARSETAWRIATTSYGPLNPPLRSGDRRDCAGWGRFDIPGGRTAYLAESRECAYAEVLAYYRRRIGDRDSLSKDAAFLELTDDALAALIEAEWATRGHVAPGHLPAGWRTSRTIYRIELPSSGWWVVLEHPDSIASAEAALGAELEAEGIDALDVAVLRGSNRAVTVLLADWVRQSLLDDGSAPHGISYQSRHATGGAWAYWLPSGRPATATAVSKARITRASPIAANDPDLRAVAERFRVTVH